MSRSLRTFSLLARPTYRSVGLSRSAVCFRRSYASQEGHQSQTVLFHDPKKRSRRAGQILARAAFILLTVWYISEHVLEEDEEEKRNAGVKSHPEASQKIGEDVTSSQEDEEDGEGEEEVHLPETMPEDAIFIPLWFPKEKPKYLYKGSDPEWQNYATLAKDPEKCKKLQQTIASILVQETSRNRRVARWFGQPIKPRRVWLDFDFPTAAPKEYERPGIEVADDYVALTNRPMTEKQYRRLQHALWPQSIARSFYASYQTLWSLQYAKLKRFFNLENEVGNRPSQLNPRAIGFPQLPGPDQKAGSRLNTELDKMVDPKSPDNKSSDAANRKTPAKPSPATSPDSSRILGSLPSIPRLSGDVAAAVTAFKQTLAKTWKPPHALERGQVPISGMVEIEGSRGLAVYDVTALYDPKKSSLVSIAVHLRRSTLKKQSPPGGR